MNKTTQKILILAISAIVVIVATTVALLVVPGLLDKEDDKEKTTKYKRPQAEEQTEAPTYDFSAPVIDDNTLTTVIDATQSAIDPNNVPTSTTPPSASKPANNGGSNNGGSNNGGSNNGGSNNGGSNNGGSNNGGSNNGETVTYQDTQSGLNVKDLIDENGVQVLGYRYSNEGDGYYYTDDKDCWQMNAGYNEVYDQMAPLTAMFIDQVRVRFNYGGKDWMIQLWKGQYGWLLVGAEIGLYTAEEGENTGAVTDINHYNCADKEDWLYMSMDCYWAEGNNGHYKKVFSRPYDKYWWPTGFVKGQLTKYTWPRTELKMKGRITFKDEAMANAFVAELKKSGFVRAAGSASSQLVDDSYYQNGADVTFLWSTVYHDCFK